MVQRTSVVFYRGRRAQLSSQRLDQQRNGSALRQEPAAPHPTLGQVGIMPHECQAGPHGVCVHASNP